VCIRVYVCMYACNVFASLLSSPKKIVCMYVLIMYVFVYDCIGYVCVCIFIYVCMYTYTHVCMYTYTHRVCEYVNIYKYVCIDCAFVHPRAVFNDFM
jgi:hypothetical protein